MQESLTLNTAFPLRRVAVKVSKAHFGVIGLGLAVGMLALGMVAFLCATVMPQIILDDSVYETGAAVELVSVEHHCSQYSPFPFADCVAVYEYVDSTGELVKGKATAQFLFCPEEEGQPLAKVDSAGNVALALFSADVGERWLAVGLFIALLLGLALLVLWVVRRQLRELFLWQSLVTSPDPILATVSKWIFEPDAAEGSGYRCHFRWEYRGLKRTGVQFFPCISSYKEKISTTNPKALRYDEPLWSSESQTQALALMGPSGKALLVPRSFKPLIPSPDEQSRLLASAVLATH